MSELKQDILEILVCPITKTSLIYNREKKELISLAAKLAFPVREGIPIMLEDEARPLNDEELKSAFTQSTIKP